MNDFLPKDYTPPTLKSNYLKLLKGKTKFRFLSSPIMGWVYFMIGDDGKNHVFRVRPDGPAPEAKLKAKHFWAAIVYDYSDKELKILEITQVTIQTQIQNLCSEEVWGSPKDYDLVITRTGDRSDGMDTEYTVTPTPKKPIAEEILIEAMKINLDALYDNGDPFEALNHKETT